MNKVRKKFVLYAEIAVFILLTVLLSVINIINFTMVSEDADRMTEAISHASGNFFQEDSNETQNTVNRFGLRRNWEMMGPNSPEMNASLRYFTYAFDKTMKKTIKLMLPLSIRDGNYCRLTEY